MIDVADPTTLVSDTGKASPNSPKVKKAPKAAKKSPKKLDKKVTHPRTIDMVVAAVKNLKERNGSSLQAIKKYIAANYKIDTEKMAPYIRKAVKTALTSGSLVQSKGKGASGSFKLPATDKPVKKTPATVAAKAKKTTTKAKKVVAAKPAAKKLKASPKKTKAVAAAGSPKKVAAEKPKAVKAKTPAKVKAALKSPAKAKKIAKGTPTKKPKTPKPKKAVAKVGAKKTAKK